LRKAELVSHIRDIGKDKAGTARVTGSYSNHCYTFPFKVSIKQPSLVGQRLSPKKEDAIDRFSLMVVNRHIAIMMGVVVIMVFSISDHQVARLLSFRLVPHRRLCLLPAI
jgi:hypothetical protein